MTNPMRLTKGEVIVGKLLTEEGVTFADGTSLITAPVAPPSPPSSYYGQVGKQGQSTITIGTAGTYQSTGITATLDTLANSGIFLGTADAFAVKNTSGETRVFQVTASMDALTANDAALGIKLALNGAPIDNTDCRGWAIQDYTAKLITTWLLELDDDDEVAMYVANHTDTANVTFLRGRVVATTVD